MSETNIPRTSESNNALTVQVGGETVSVHFGPSGTKTSPYKVWGTFRGEYIEGKGKTVDRARQNWEEKARWRARE